MIHPEYKPFFVNILPVSNMPDQRILETEEYCIRVGCNQDPSNCHENKGGPTCWATIDIRTNPQGTTPYKRTIICGKTLLGRGKITSIRNSEPKVDNVLIKLGL